MPSTVTVRAFMRWLLLEKAEASRDLWQRYLAADDKVKFIRELSQAENELRQWAMIKDEY